MPRPYLKSIEEDTLLLLDGETDHLTGILIDGAVLIFGDALHGIARLKEASGRRVVRELLLRLGIKRHILLLLVRHVERSGGCRRRSGPPDKGTRRRREGIAPARKEGKRHRKESGVHPEDHLDTENLNACGARACMRVHTCTCWRNKAFLLTSKRFSRQKEKIHCNPYERRRDEHI